MKRHLSAMAAGTALRLISLALGAVLLLSLAACSHTPPIQHGAMAPGPAISNSRSVV